MKNPDSLRVKFVRKGNFIDASHSLKNILRTSGPKKILNAGQNFEYVGHKSKLNRT